MPQHELVHTIGRSASVGLVLPYSRADVSGDVSSNLNGEVREQQQAVTRSGLADPRLRLAGYIPEFCDFLR